MAAHPSARLLAVLLLAASVDAAAQSCDPAALSAALRPHLSRCRNLTLYSGFAPGGGTDLVARVFEPYLRSVSGLPVVVEAAPGASGEVASGKVVSGPANQASCRALVAQANQLTSNQLNAEVPSHAKQLRPLAVIAESPLLLVVNAKQSKFQSFEQLREGLAGGQLFFGSNGPFGVDHVATEVLLARLGAKATHVPYKGRAPMLADLLAPERRLDFALLPEGLAKPYLGNGTLRALAAGAELNDGVPAPGGGRAPVPAFPDYSASTWMALAVAQNLPAAAAEAYRAAAVCFAADAGSIRRLSSFEFKPGGATGEALSARIESELAAARAGLGR